MPSSCQPSLSSHTSRSDESWSILFFWLGMMAKSAGLNPFRARWGIFPVTTLGRIAGQIFFSWVTSLPGIKQKEIVGEKGEIQRQTKVPNRYYLLEEILRVVLLITTRRKRKVSAKAADHFRRTIISLTFSNEARRGGKKTN